MQCGNNPLWLQGDPLLCAAVILGVMVEAKALSAPVKKSGAGGIVHGNPV